MLTSRLVNNMVLLLLIKTFGFITKLLIVSSTYYKTLLLVKRFTTVIKKDSKVLSMIKDKR